MTMNASSLQVIVVDHDKDSGLCYIDEMAAEAVSNAIKSGAEACVYVSPCDCCIHQAIDASNYIQRLSSATQCSIQMLLIGTSGPKD